MSQPRYVSDALRSLARAVLAFLLAASIASAVRAAAAAGASAGAPGASGGAASTTSGAAGTNLPLMQYGALELRPHVAYHGSYNTGLLARPGFARDSYIDTFAPGFLVKYGEQWTVDYTPTLTLYSDPRFRDTLNHSVVANAALLFRNFAAGVHQSYTYASAPLIETGRQTDTETIETDFNVSHPLSPKLVLLGNVQQKLTFVSTAPDFHTWSAFGGLEVRPSSRVTGRVGMSSGYVLYYKSPDMIYAQPSIDATWKPISKLSLNGSLAADERIVLSHKWIWREAPLFSGSVLFEPFSVTSLKGKVGRTISPSLFGGQSSDRTVWSASGQQRVLQHFWLSGGVDYDDVKYLTTGKSLAVPRKDHSWTYSVAIRTNFLRRGMGSLSYQETDNASNLPGFSHTTKRIGWDVSYRY